MQVQVRAVQKIGREDARRSVWRQRGQTRSNVSSSSTVPSAAPAPSTGAPHHGDVQPVHAVQGGIAEVQPRGVGREAQVGRVHGGRWVVQDTGRAQHLAVEVVDQRQGAVGLHAQQRGTCGALQEVLQASAARARLSGEEGLCWRGWGEVEGRWGRGRGGWIGVERGEGRVWVGLEAGDF